MIADGRIDDARRELNPLFIISLDEETGNLELISPFKKGYIMDTEIALADVALKKVYRDDYAGYGLLCRDDKPYILAILSRKIFREVLNDAVKRSTRRATFGLVEKARNQSRKATIDNLDI